MQKDVEGFSLTHAGFILWKNNCKNNTSEVTEYLIFKILFLYTIEMIN